MSDLTIADWREKMLDRREAELLELGQGILSEAELLMDEVRGLVDDVYGPPPRPRLRVLQGGDERDEED